MIGLVHCCLNAGPEDVFKARTGGRREWKIMRVTCCGFASFAVAVLAIARALRPRRPNRRPKTVSGLPIPRFVSLKTDQVNVRGGPTKDHDVTWVYNRAGLPVEITAEFETWRRIRDWEGAEGWVYHSLLSGRRTATIAPNGKEQGRTAGAPRQARRQTARSSAQLQVGVLGSVKRCTGSWCRIYRRAVRRLDPAGTPVGRLPQREAGLTS